MSQLTRYLVFHLATGAGYPRYDGREIGAAIVKLCEETVAAANVCPLPPEVPLSSGIRAHRADSAPAKGTRPTFDEAGGDREVGLANQMPQHPPLYYETLAAGLRLERALTSGTWPLDREFALLRWANVALAAPLPLLVWWAARRLGLTDSVAVVAAFVPFVIPQLLHTGSTINNDNLLVLLGGVIIVLLAGVLRGDRSVRTGVLIGVVTGLALLTKAFAVIFVPTVAAVYGVAVWRERHSQEVAKRLVSAEGTEDRAADLEPWWRSGAPALAAGIVAATFSAWWYVTNLVRTGSMTPTVEDQRLSSEFRPLGFSPDPGFWIRRFGAFLVERFWGWFGWYTVRLSFWLIVAATVILLALLAFGIYAAPSAPLAAPGQNGRTEGANGLRMRRIDVALLLLPTALLVAFVASWAWRLYVRTASTPFIQGRYVFGGVVGVAVVAGIGLWRAARRWALPATLGWAAVMNIDGIRRALAVYWGGPGIGLRGQLEAMVAWSPWSGGLLAIGALVAGLVATWLAIEVFRFVRIAQPSRRSPVSRRAGTG